MDALIPKFTFSGNEPIALAAFSLSSWEITTPTIFAPLLLSCTANLVIPGCFDIALKDQLATPIFDAMTGIVILPPISSGDCQRGQTIKACGVRTLTN